MGCKVKGFSDETREFLKQFGFNDEDDIVKGFNDYIQEEYGSDIKTLISKLGNEIK